MKDKLKSVLKKVLEEIKVDIEPLIERPKDTNFGDYTTNIVLQSRISHRETQELVEKLHKENIEGIKEIGSVGGFINFYLSEDYLLKSLDKKELHRKSSGQKILVEFAHPNTHKEFHIGHLRNISLGESISRILTEAGCDVKRVNYQGDVGLHVAKALYGIQTLGFENKEKISLTQKAKFLGKAYAFGSKAYEDDPKAKEKIIEINKKIYSKDPSILKLWGETRKWSLDYFDSIYKRLYTKFDRLYFESEVYESGKKIVVSHIDDEIFKKSDGAIIFDAERYGFHKRVFITAEGNPTYEAKEMGLGFLQYKDFEFDKVIHVVGPEQAGYFKVVFKALELIDPVFKDKEDHLSYGFVQLKEGKMSSRLGQVVSGEWLLDEAKKRIKSAFKNMDEKTLEEVVIGAVKYSMLKFGRNSNIQFSFDESISLEGDSGPYIQYVYARTQSVLAKANPDLLSSKKDQALNEEDLLVLRTLNKFEDIVGESAESLAPNLLCNYLFDLCQRFNFLYQKHQILGNSQRLKITEATGKVIKKGLGLLGIEAPERM